MALVTANQFQQAPSGISNIVGGFQTGRGLRNQFQGDQAAQQKVQADQDAAKRATQLSNMQFVGSAASGLLKLPIEERPAALARLTSRFEEMGIPASDLEGFEPTDANLRSITTSAAAFRDPVSALDQAKTAKLQTEVERGPAAVVGTASQRDFKTYNDLLKTDPEKARIFGLQSGFIPKIDEAQTKADIAVDKAARKEVAKANTKRIQGFIDSGIEAADTAANVKRSIELLKTVETGGIDAALLRAKQLFGIEGADEAELSTNLGKNVLAQLKPIFGSAFTVKEGEELKRIEAGFGKSTAGNIRLLERTLKIADRAARRGIAAAKDQGDAFTENEIRSSLEFKADEQPETPALQTAPEVQEGQIIVNRKTGQRMQQVNGQFVEIQ